MMNQSSKEEAIEIIHNLHFAMFNEFCKLNRNAGSIKKFDAALKALGMMERAAKYLAA